MMLQADFRLALTGTPVENYLDELWSLFHFINPGLLGSRESFQQALRPADRAGPQRRRPSGAAGAGRPLHPAPDQGRRADRTAGADRADHPGRSGRRRSAHFYEALRRRALERIETCPAMPAASARSTSWRRSPGCGGPAAIRRWRLRKRAGCEAPSWSLFLDLVDELLRNRHKALVFSQFVGLLDLVREALDAARHRATSTSTARPRRASASAGSTRSRRARASCS